MSFMIHLRRRAHTWVWITVLSDCCGYLRRGEVISESQDVTDTIYDPYKSIASA